MDAFPPTDELLSVRLIRRSWKEWAALLEARGGRLNSDGGVMEERVVSSIINHVPATLSAFTSS